MEILIIIFSIIVIFFIGFYSGCFAMARHIETTVKNSIANRLKQVEEKALIIPIVIEKQGDRYFAYNKNTKEFICHGDSQEELVKEMRNKHKNPTRDIIFSADTDNLEEIGWKFE